MKTSRFSVLLLFVLLIPFVFNSGFTFQENPDRAVVMVDGKEIKPEGVIKMDRDDTILFEAEGLKPNSRVDFKVKKLGIRFIKDSYYVNSEGKIKEILYIPNMKIKVKAFVKYQNADGESIDVKFKFKIV